MLLQAETARTQDKATVVRGIGKDAGFEIQLVS